MPIAPMFNFRRPCSAFGSAQMHEQHRRTLSSSLVLAALSIGACQTCLAQDPSGSVPAASILFHDVRIFDGKSSALSPVSSVLISGNVIKHISAAPVTFDGNGK